MHRDPETAEPGNGISIYAFLYYVENYGPQRAIPRTRPALTRNVRDNLARLDYCIAALSFPSLSSSSRGARHSFRRGGNVTNRASLSTWVSNAWNGSTTRLHDVRPIFASAKSRGCRRKSSRRRTIHSRETISRPISDRFRKFDLNKASLWKYQFRDYARSLGASRT